MDHVLQDIDRVRQYTEALKQTLDRDGRISHSTFMALLQGGGRDEGSDRQALHAALNFVRGGMRSIFLQDANSLILKPGDLIRILERLKESFPGVERITSYARAKTIARISGQDMERLARAGLNRVHVGLESGSDAVLARVKKGVDKATQIEAGLKVRAAGMELSEYHMPGLGGKDLSRENALETADALNQINPDFIRLRSLALPEGAPLTEQHRQGEFTKLGEVDTARELLLFLESLGGITSKVRSDHILNLFPEVDGTLPQDKDLLMAPVREYLGLPAQEQLLYSLGRRSQAMSGLSDLRDPAKRHAAEQVRVALEANVENMDVWVNRIMQGFV